MDANEQELAAARVNCKRGCPGPSLLEVARGGHNCDNAIWRATFAEGSGKLTILPDPELERARATAATLEDQLARIEALCRAELEDAGEPLDPGQRLACNVLDIVIGADVERRDALAALAAEPVQS